MLSYLITASREKLGLCCQPDRPGSLYRGKEDSQKRDNKRYSRRGKMICMYVDIVYIITFLHTYIHTLVGVRAEATA